MSAAVLTGTDARRPPRPSWGQAFGAVIGGMVLAWALLFVWLLPLDELRLVPVSASGGGHGWPWRIDGAWSFAADLGPLLLCSATVAYGIDAFTTRWAGVRSRRLPLALAALLLGSTPLSGENTGLLAVDGVLGFVLLVWLTRQSFMRESRPLRWTPARAFLAVLTTFALAATTVSYGLLHPLTVADAGPPDEVATGRP